MLARHSLLLACSASVIAVSSFAFAQNPQASCSSIIEGPYSTFTEGIDNAGDVVGYYENQNGGNDGYLLTADGNETIIDYPGFVGATQAYGINNVGQVVGTAGGNVFIYNVATQTFTTVDLEGNSNSSLVAINDSGTVVGSTVVNDTAYGYMVEGSTLKLLLPPGATSASAFGISRNGTVIGSATLGSGSNIYYRYLGGKYSQITNVPGLSAISPSATILAGNSVNQYGTDVGLVEHRTNRGLTFLCNDGETVAIGVNDSGKVVGFFGYIGDPFVDGYVWTPAAAKPRP